VDAPLAALWGFGLLLFRTAGLCVTAPVLGARVVPQRVRLGVSVMLAFAVFQGAGAPAVAPPPDLLALGGAAALETGLGLLGGLAARWVLDAALAAGHLAGLSAGLGFSALVDPVSGAESTGLSQLFFAGAQLFALSLGIHREAVAWLARGATAFPPGAAHDLGPVLAAAIGQAVLSMALAVRLAFPVLAAVLMGHAAMGVMNRMAPQLNLANVGFSIAILAGGVAVYLSAPAAAELAARAAIATFAR
jgi:flagellar biosynthetic protein FliR